VTIKLIPPQPQRPAAKMDKKKATANAGPSLAHASQKRSKADQSKGRSNEERPRYADFFPGAESAFKGTVVVPQGNPYVANVATQQAGDILVDAFDIPLFMRQNQVAGKAFAKIARHKDRSLTAIFIDGNPVLRAVLYEALLDQRNRATVHRFFDGFGQQVITIRLRFKTTNRGGHSHNTQVSYTESGVSIIRYFSKGNPDLEMGQAGTSPTGDPAVVIPITGIPLPDEEAKRAIRRDRTILKRLRMSPAHIAPIRNRPLN
jgi:hypothetical protein